ncbi:hypothetical protein [Candidatus Methylomicrobium oryzae]|jgi:hypothetical protein|uniref:hypothetical protein n=1 Tax=Candidatus Methylomicrobium oryzae TaxID=2802053 RepID=UPI0019204FB4|nr:hypothetical protein [Methylomicrobium sp. RS1]MBL1262634.1 hypothetical protein [Methylomicrobium sp. RS1]
MRYVITGRVHPESDDIWFGPIEWKTQIPYSGRVIVQCESSQVTIFLDLSAINDYGTAHHTAEHFAITIIGALGFSLGSGYSVELIQVIEEDGTPHVLGVRPMTEDAPPQTLGFSPHDPIFERAFKLANENIFFRLALRDFLRAINDTTDRATYCYRAIESIKSAFVFKTGKDRWDDMHRALGTNHTTIRAKVKNFADPVQHGNWINTPETPEKDQWNMLLLTRDILQKYLDYELPAT